MIITVRGAGKRLPQLGRRTEPRDQVEPVLVPNVPVGQPIGRFQHVRVQTFQAFRRLFRVFFATAVRRRTDEQEILDVVLVPDRLQRAVHRDRTTGTRAGGPKIEIFPRVPSKCFSIFKTTGDTRPGSALTVFARPVRFTLFDVLIVFIRRRW